MNIRRVHRLGLGLAIGAAALTGTVLPAAAQGADCDEMMERMRENYLTNHYDNLATLRANLNTFVRTLRQYHRPYDTSFLDDLTTADIESQVDRLRLLKKCMPRIGELLRDIKARLEQLEDMASVSATANPRGSHRGRTIDDLLTEHDGVGVALTDAFERAGIDPGPGPSSR
ncbi:MAG: hypothetical protein MJB57_04510 [Gemmatimonadetes bacterium]|nr:hypothetical protein [Gemmatimonadota bacterium]